MALFHGLLVAHVLRPISVSKKLNLWRKKPLIEGLLHLRGWNETISSQFINFFATDLCRSSVWSISLESTSV